MFHARSLWPVFVGFATIACASSDKTIAIHNTRPEVTFEEPGEGEKFELEEAISFVAFVYDKESDPADLELEWTSDLYGLLGEGTTPSVEGEATLMSSALGEGLHTITLKVTDPQGLIGSDYMTLKVESNCLEYADCDFDGDGYTEDEGDCDDNNPGRNPDVAEYYNEVDDDCDGLIDEGSDAYDDDGDGYSEFDGDCDDQDPETSPDALEVCDGVDNDCDGDTDEDDDDTDFDEDGYSACDYDCDDEDPEINPDAFELCDEIDNDCDGDIDADDSGTDIDGDGWGFCDLTPDCNDLDVRVYPGATEICDPIGIDEDCDGEVNEAGAEGSRLFFEDADGDGFGSPDGFGMFCALPATGYADNMDDCDDEDPDISPGSEEVCDDEIDNDCDGDVDGDDDDLDGDEDGYSICSTDEEPGDCDDARPDVYPGAFEIEDGVDNDCDGLIDNGTLSYDDDGDGYSEVDGDCNDGDSAIHPGAIEVCDDVDNDCDGVTDGEGTPGAMEYFLDEDGDGFGVPFGSLWACGTPPYGYVEPATDCNDGDSAIHPDSPEVCDGVDNDCDGETDGPDAEGAVTVYRDLDGDRYGDGLYPFTGCEADVPSGYVGDNTDCDDSNDRVHPGAPEICDAGEDNDCDGDIDEAGADYCTEYFLDQDGDGFGSEDSRCLCSPEDDYTATSNTDCYDDPDNGRFVHPGTTLYYTTDRGDGSFDYNCNSVQEMRWGTDDMEGDCSGYLGSCDATPGWSGGSPPSCGVPRSWRSGCESSGFLGLTDCDWGRSESRTQECR